MLHKARTVLCVWLVVTVVTGLAWLPGFLQSTLLETALADGLACEGLQGFVVDPFQNDDPDFSGAPVTGQFNPPSRFSDLHGLLAMVLPEYGRRALLFSLRC